MKKCVARLTTSPPEIGAAFVAGMKPTYSVLSFGRAGPLQSHPPHQRSQRHRGHEGQTNTERAPTVRRCSSGSWGGRRQLKDGQVAREGATTEGRRKINRMEEKKTRERRSGAGLAGSGGCSSMHFSLLPCFFKSTSSSSSS